MTDPTYEAVWNALPQAAMILDAEDCFVIVNGAAE
ncbi:MAG: hypothetical protein ACJARE_003497, partial [Paracoccaceae bacterium]